jgi:hypothetical protein
MDLFNHQEELPQKVKDVLKEFEDCEFTYDSCAQLVSALNEVGYTCDYYLDAEPYHLRKIIKAGDTYTYKELGLYHEDVNCYSAEFTKKEEGTWEYGKYVIELTNKENPNIKMKFILKGFYAGDSLFICSETTYDLEFHATL